MVVVVVMIHLSLVVLDLVWVVDSGDCSLIVSLGFGGCFGGLVIVSLWWWFVRLVSALVWV